ncbi:MAG: protein phosphatase 2C domain-containing protein [Methanomicrobium sp.]|nr:protein phosphatase 2C domain-containing protein [Methanomicrobium sp.]
MIGFYNQTIPGRSHIEDGAPCQDANGVTRLENGWIIAAVAKGISGTMNSAAAASVAVVTSIRLLKEHSELINFSDAEALKALIYLSFFAAQQKIDYYAEINGFSPQDCDTTLTIAVYDGKRVAYGHSGYGGGILTLDENGTYRRLTPVQIADTHDEKYSLRTGRDKWSFGFSDEERVCSVLMATDGLFDVFCPQILAMMSNPVDIHEVRGYMDTGLWKFNTVDELKSQKKLFDEMLREKFPTVTDDKTAVLIVNTEVLPKVKADKYYDKTDFEAMSQCESDVLYYGSDGKEYLLEDKILDIDADNSSIYSVYNNAEIFAVIYDDILGKVVSRLSKIASVIDAAESRSAVKLLDVPAVLYDRNEMPKGYIKLIGRGETDYEKFCRNPTIDLKQRLKVAINLTVALDRLHNAGLIAGDLAPAKIGIDGNGTVHLSNCESYIVRNAKKSDGFKFDPSRVDIVHMAPEIRSRIGSKFLYYRFSVETDLYSLAFLIYRLLAFGNYPSDSGDEDNTDGEYKSVQDVRGYLPAKIVSLFERALIAGKTNPKARPSISDWYFTMLNEYDSIIQCEADKKHYYWEEFEECPWCRMDGRTSKSASASRSPEVDERAEGIKGRNVGGKAKGRSNKSETKGKTGIAGKTVKSAKANESVKSSKAKESGKSGKAKDTDVPDVSEKSAGSVKSDKAGKSAKAGKSDKADKTDKSDKSDKSKKSDKADKSDKSDSTKKSKKK